MILVKNSKCLFSLLFGIRDLVFMVSWCCFPKRRLFRPHKCHLTMVKKLRFSKGADQWFWLNITNFFQVSFFCKRDLGFSSDDVVFSKWVFLDYKNVISLWSKNLRFFKGVNSWFLSKIPIIFGAYFSGKETLVFSFDDVVYQKEAF